MDTIAQVDQQRRSSSALATVSGLLFSWVFFVLDAALILHVGHKYDRETGSRVGGARLVRSDTDVDSADRKKGGLFAVEDRFMNVSQRR